MVEIICPHCEGDIELPDGEYGEFSCPLCEEDFMWEKDAISEDESDNGAVSFIESENIELSHKLAAIAVVIVIFLILMALSSAFSSGETDTGSWPVEQVEIVEITNEGYTFIGEGSNGYYAVDIVFMYESRERSWTLECNEERYAEGYVENNPVGTTIDIRVNPVKGESPFFEIEGGCPSVEYSTTEIVSSVACFGILIAIIGFEKISDLIRSKRQG
tara:strand:+ start:199 stop:849 length:651 start_codon:yes stop_codon:yes gene_type:complete